MQSLAIQAPTPISARSQTGTSAGHALALMRQCGRRELPPDGRAGLRALAASFGPTAWDNVPGLARQHGLGPLVFKHLAETELLEGIPAGVVAELRAAYCAALVTNRRLEIERDRLAALLAARGVEVLLLKGVTLAARYYRNIALRPSSDLDVLVRREQLASCLQALRDAGYAPQEGAGKPLDPYVLYYLELDYRSSAGVRVEPHLALARLPAYRQALAVEQVWARALPIEMGGVAARYLHPWDELRYLSVHYSVPHQASRLIWLVDIAELVRTHTAPGADAWDWEGFVRETIQRGVAMPVAVALQHARDQLDLDLPPLVLPALHAAAVTRHERKAWVASQAASSNLARLSGHLLSLPTVAEKLAFAWGAGRIGGQRVLGYLSRANGASSSASGGSSLNVPKAPEVAVTDEC